jgi:hypothetical protein
MPDHETTSARSKSAEEASATHGATNPTKLGESPPEKLLTYAAAAEALGVPAWKIQRAARAGLFPTYRVFNGRRLLKLSEIVAVINGTRDGGDQ